MKKSLKKSKIFIAEVVWDVIGGVITFFGLVLMIFGVAGRYLTGSLDDNFIKSAESALAKSIGVNLGFSIWGILFMILGLAIIIITLCVYAKKADRDLDKVTRRQQRLAGSLSEMEIKPAVQTIAEPVVEAKPVEDK